MAMVLLLIFIGLLSFWASYMHEKKSLLTNMQHNAVILNRALIISITNQKSIAEKVRTTGKKLDDKIYYHHSGYPGGIKAKTLRERLSKEPEKVISDAVWGMLPKNRLGRAMLKKLKVYKGSAHPHAAQKPEILQYKEF